MTDFVDNFKKLNDNQQKALPLLLMGENNKNVANKLGVDENTIYRWRNDPNFKNILNEMRRQSLESIERQLHSLGSKAITELTFLLENATNENNKLKASTFILEKILQYQQIELIKRIDALEERLNLK